MAAVAVALTLTALPCGARGATPDDAPREPRPLYMGLKTNMLYDLVALPNVGAEIYVGRGVSLQASWMYAWWSSDRRHRYWRAYGGDIGARLWLGSRARGKPLSGHHVGVMAGVLTYDFEWGGRGYMGGKPDGTLWERCNFMAAVEYGYSLPVSRRLNIDFSIALGYIGGRYIEYDPGLNDYIYRASRRLNWWGPVKAEVSLVWLIGRGNVNK